MRVRLLLGDSSQQAENFSLNVQLIMPVLLVPVPLLRSRLGW